MLRGIRRFPIIVHQCAQRPQVIVVSARPICFSRSLPLLKGSEASAAAGENSPKKAAAVVVDKSGGKHADAPQAKPLEANAVAVGRGAEWRRLVFSSWQRGIFTALGIATGIGILVFLLAAPMKEDTVQQTAHIASQALEDQKLKETATRLSKEVVEQILTDPRSVVLLADVVQTLLKQETSKIAVTSFIRDIFEDRYTQEITKKFVLKVVSDPWVMDQLHHILFSLVEDLLRDPDTKEVLKEVLVNSSVDALKDEAFQAQGGRAVRSIVWQTIWNSKNGAVPATSSAGTSTHTDAAPTAAPVAGPNDEHTFHSLSLLFASASPLSICIVVRVSYDRIGSIN